MITRCVAALMALACSSATQSELPAAGLMDAGMPPERFRANSAAVVVFTDRAGIDKYCGVAKPPFRIIACAHRMPDGTPVVLMPNPCPLGDFEYYAKIMCHEMGHVQGWGSEHEE